MMASAGRSGTNAAVGASAGRCCQRPQVTQPRAAAGLILPPASCLLPPASCLLAALGRAIVLPTRRHARRHASSPEFAGALRGCLQPPAYSLLPLMMLHLLPTRRSRDAVLRLPARKPWGRRHGNEQRQARTAWPAPARCYWETNTAQVRQHILLRPRLLILVVFFSITSSCSDRLSKPSAITYMSLSGPAVPLTKSLAI